MKLQEELGGVECGTCVTCAQLGRETREITPFPSILLLISHAVTVQHVLWSSDRLQAAVLRDSLWLAWIQGYYTTFAKHLDSGNVLLHGAGVSTESEPGPKPPRIASL